VKERRTSGRKSKESNYRGTNTAYEEENMQVGKNEDLPIKRKEEKRKSK